MRARLLLTQESALGNKHMNFLWLVFLEELILMSNWGIHDYPISFVCKSLQPQDTAIFGTNGQP